MGELLKEETNKECKKCKKSYPMNTDFYFRKKDTKDGFTIRCKECMGKKFTKKLQQKEGYKFCLKCDRELKIDHKFYPRDKTCRDGHRGVCRECMGYEFLPEDYSPRKFWTKKEEQLLFERYPHYTNDELVEIFYPNLKKKHLADKASRLGVSKSEETYWRARAIGYENMRDRDFHPLEGVKFSEERRKRHAKIFKEKYSGENSYWYGKKRSKEEREHGGKIRRARGQWKGENNPRHKTPLYGKENGNWKGGVTPKSKKLRNTKDYQSWRNSVFEKDNFTCQYCGDNKGGNLEAHHIENFSEHQDKRFNVNNGITLCNSHHNPNVKNSFHNTFGTFNNNLEQLHEYFTGIHWNISTKKIEKSVLKKVGELID